MFDPENRAAFLIFSPLNRRSVLESEIMVVMSELNQQYSEAMKIPSSVRKRLLARYSRWLKGSSNG